MFKRFFAVGAILAAGAVSVMAAGIDTGIVKDNLGANVVGATVTYTRAPNTWTATTDSNGIYRFALGGTQSITVIGSATGAGTLVASKIGYVNSPAGALTVTPADTTTPSAIGNALLSVTIRTTSGSIVDSSNASAVDSAKIRQKRAGAIIDSVFSNASGVYTLNLVATGDSLIVTGPSYFGKKAVEPTLSATVSTNTINFTLSAFGSVLGTVDSLLGGHGPIKGATVSLARVVGGVAQAPFTLTTTDSTGRYELDSIFAHVPYQAAASATGFSSVFKQMPSGNKLKGVDSVSFVLGPATAGIKGTVTTDSLKGPTRAGAKVILTKGASIVHVDSAVTDSMGGYSFANDSVGLSYTVTGSYNGYQTTAVTFTKTDTTDVENIVLQPGSNKTFWVKVLGTGSAPLANASVGFTNGPSVIGGTTNALGVYQVTNAPVGFDTITVADSIYIAQLNLFTLSAHAADTVTYTLTQIATGTVPRAIRGTAHKLTATGAVAAGATINFKCAGGWVFAATTLATAPIGSWSVVGIPAAIPATASIPAYAAATGLGLRATLPPSVFPTRDTTWNPYTNAAAIAITATGTTTNNTVVFTAGTIVSVLPEVAEKTEGAPAFSVLHSGIISLKNMTAPGMVKVYLQGQMLYSHAFEANTASLRVPALAQGKAAFVVSITQNKAEYKRVVLMP